MTIRHLGTNHLLYSFFKNCNFSLIAEGSNIFKFFYFSLQRLTLKKGKMIQKGFLQSSFLSLFLGWSSCWLFPFGGFIYQSFPVAQLSLLAARGQHAAHIHLFPSCKQRQYIFKKERPDSFINRLHNYEGIQRTILKTVRGKLYCLDYIQCYMLFIFCF